MNPFVSATKNRFGILCGIAFGMATCTLPKREAGNIPPHLQGVITYYSQEAKDSLKRQAACFLLQNMQGHAGCPEMTADCETMYSTSLVAHIEQRFRLKDSCPWLQKMYFQTFLEYLLPYRVADEDWRKMPHQDSVKEEKYAYALAYYDDCRKSASRMEAFLSGDKMLRDPIAFSQALEEVKWLRAHGVPSAVDFIPAAEDEENAWVWVADDRLQPPLPTYMKRNRIGKVYRTVYSRQSVLEAGNGEYIPPFFQNPFYKDVTEDYLHGKTVTLPLPESIHMKHAYLAMPEGERWKPVAWCSVKERKCRFEHLGTEAVYLPVCYQDSLPTAISAPFILREDGTQDVLQAQGKRTLRIMRMAPYNSMEDWQNNYFPGSHFESASDKDFQTDSTAYKIPCHPHYAWGEIQIETPRARRYWRHAGKKIFPFHIAELRYTDKNGNSLKGQFFGPDTEGIKVIEDENPDTYKTYKGWIGMDFGKPVEAAKIRYLLAGDGGEVKEGVAYKLFYWQENQWHSAGIQKAQGREVVFTDVPANGLYRLVELEGEKRSCIFTIENERVQYR